MTTTRLLRNLCAVLGLAALPVLASAAPALIANKNVASEKVDTATLKAILLGKKIAWDSSGRIVLAILKSGPIADESLKQYADLTASAFNSHWRRLAMTGGGTAPKFFEQDAEVRKFVAETPGAIGFVDSASVDASVSLLSIAP